MVIFLLGRKREKKEAFKEDQIRKRLAKSTATESLLEKICLNLTIEYVFLTFNLFYYNLLKNVCKV